MSAKNALKANKSESKKRVSGIATIKTGKDKARITFQDDNTQFDNGKNVKTFALDDLPRVPKLNPESEDDYFVVLNSDGDEVEVISPVEGVFQAQCVDLSRPNEDDDPAPFEVTPKKEGWASYLAFLAFFEITNGTFKKIKIPYFLHYKFSESKEDEGFAAWMGDPENRKATRLHQLIEFCEKLDLVSDAIEWPEDGNILPELLNRILKNKKIVKIVVKNGYIDSLMTAHPINDEPNEEVEDDGLESDSKEQKVKTPKNVDEEDEEL